MAQINITLSQDEVLQVLSGNRDDAFKFLLERILNEIMKAESEEQLGASKHERSDHRTDYRNGTRERALTTRLGTLTLEYPDIEMNLSIQWCLKTTNEAKLH